MCLDDAVAAFNPAKRIKGKTMWWDAPPSMKPFLSSLNKGGA
jgi:hypothetical protein